MWYRRNISVQLIVTVVTTLCVGILLIWSSAFGNQSIWFVDFGSRSLANSTQIRRDIMSKVNIRNLDETINSGKSAQAQFSWKRPSWILFELSSDSRILNSYEWQPWSKTPWVIIHVRIKIEGSKIKFINYPGRAPFSGIHVGSLEKLHKILGEKEMNPHANQ